MDMLRRVAGRVAERFPADLERIRGYLRMPSVSATGEGIRDVAEARDLPGIGPAVVARGSANFKGCLACFFLAVELLRELDAMPLFVFDRILGLPWASGGVGAGDGTRR
jgi:hypothetical protein